MKTFDKFWADLLKVLDTRRKIRNWTAYNSHAAGGTFFARSVRSLDKKTRTYVLQNVFVSFPENLIVCTQVRGETSNVCGKKEFRGSIWKVAYLPRQSYVAAGIRRGFTGHTLCNLHI